MKTRTEMREDNGSLSLQLENIGTNNNSSKKSLHSPKKVVIKQESNLEDVKNILYPSANRTLRSSVVIKAENCTAMMNQPANEDEKIDQKILDFQPDLGYYCRVCKKKYPASSNYREHLTETHKIEISKSLIILNSHILPDKHDPNHHCKSCKWTYTTKANYHRHLQDVHKMMMPLRRVPKIRLKPDSQIQPDKHDLNNYCKSCKWTFSSKQNYHLHLQKIHKMTPPAKKECVRPQPDLNILPDEDDPNYHCKPCKWTFSSKQRYRYHLKKIHEMTPITGIRRSSAHHLKCNPQILPDKHNPNNYCKSCKWTFSSKQNYYLHLQKIHKMTLPAKKECVRLQPDSNVLPDEDDPNYHCKSCKRTFSSKQSYHNHLKKIHEMTPITGIRRSSAHHLKCNPQILPDKHNPNNYCKSCKWTFSSKQNYYLHLQKIHKMTPPAKKECVRLQPDSNVLPDEDDPNYHCKSCKRTFSSKQSYHNHLKKIHEMTPITGIRRSSAHHLKCNPQILPDKHNPNNYCKSCKWTFSSKQNYYLHLQKIHNMTPPVTKNRQHDPNILPDEHDPHIYCKSCNRAYTSKYGYHDHLQKFHKMAVTSLKTGSRRRSNPINILPDEHDPNHYCKACKWTYASKQSYHNHLQRIHEFTITTKKRELGDQTPSEIAKENGSNKRRRAGSFER